MKKLFALILTLMMSLTLAACGEDLEDELVDITLESNLDDAELTQDPPEAAEGMEVTVSASEEEGYDFVRWIDAETEDEVSDERDYTFTVEEAITLEAVYEESDDNGNGDDTYAVDLSSDLSEADLSVDEEGPYEEGDEITVEASEVDTYDFVRWVDSETDDELSTDRTYTFTVDEDLDLEAVYEDTLNTDERKAQDVVDDASDDPEALDTLLDEFDPDDGMTMELDMTIDEKMPESEETITRGMTLELSTDMDGDTRMTKMNMTMDMPDTDEETTTTLFMEEGEDSTTFTMDAGVLLDMIEEESEMDADLRTLLDLESDYVYLTVPDDPEDSDMEAFYDAVYEQLLGSDYDESDVPEFDEETMESLHEDLEDLKDLMSFTNLSSFDDLEMERSGTIAEGTFTVGGETLSDFAEDLIEEAYTALEAADEDDQLEPYDDFKASQEYILVMTAIESLQIPISMEYDVEAGTFFMDIGLNTLVDNLSGTDESLEAIEDVTMDLTLEKDTAVDDDLSDAENLETISEEVLKFITVVETENYLSNIKEDGVVSEGTYTLEELKDEGVVSNLPYLDQELSEVTVDVSDDDTRSVEAELYYDHDESDVFVNTPITLDELQDVMDEEPQDHEDVEAIIALIDDDNFDLYPILGETMAMMVEESQSEEDTSDSFPEEDQEDIEEPTLFDRYDPSYAVYYDTEGSQEFYDFVADATSEDVREHFSTTLEDDGWTEEINQENTQDSSVDYDMYYTNETEGYGLSISIKPDSGYDTGIRYSVTVQPLE